MPKQSKGKDAIQGTDAAHSPAHKSTKPNKKRSAPSTSRDRSSSSSSAPRSTSQQPNKKPRFEKPASSSGLPGASKIKASIRQTNRLLAKPNLAPGTKIEAERRLKALQADLEVASRKQVEKSRASRYHRVKFVERQKLVRRIARCKRNLARLDAGDSAHGSDSEAAASDDGDDDGDEGYAMQRAKESTMSKEELVKLLSTLRELLQYVVQYPADVRYVALFPNGAQGPIPPDAHEKDKSRQMAFQHLQSVRKAIKDGQISDEPEVELSSKDRSLKKLVSPSSTNQAGTESRNNTSRADKKADNVDKKKRKHEESDSDDDRDQAADGTGGVRGDDFFAHDSDDE